MDMQTGWNENRALLRGTAAAEPVRSHETHGVVIRDLSHRRPAACPARRTGQHPGPPGPAGAAAVTEGMELEVEGEMRSFNNKSGKAAAW